MSKAGYFARPVEADGKHHAQAPRDGQEEQTRWSDAVHKVADTVRSWLPSSGNDKDR